MEWGVGDSITSCEMSVQYLENLPRRVPYRIIISFIFSPSLFSFWEWKAKVASLRAQPLEIYLPLFPLQLFFLLAASSSGSCLERAPGLPAMQTWHECNPHFYETIRRRLPRAAIFKNISLYKIQREYRKRINQRRWVQNTLSSNARVCLEDAIKNCGR